MALVRRNGSRRRRVARLGLCILAGVLCQSSAAQAGPGRWLHLFHVGHDDSANVVQYDIVVDGTCQPLGHEPIRAYWRNTKGKKRARSLSALERRAYGVRLQVLEGDSQVSFRVAARPEQVAHAALVGSGGSCKAQLWTSVKGERAILERAWIRTEKRAWWRLPKVLFVDLFAQSSGGDSLIERIFP